jgi:hypothetical protein
LAQRLALTGGEGDTGYPGEGLEAEDSEEALADFQAAAEASAVAVPRAAGNL